MSIEEIYKASKAWEILSKLSLEAAMENGGNMGLMNPLTKADVTSIMKIRSVLIQQLNDACLI